MFTSEFTIAGGQGHHHNPMLMMGGGNNESSLVVGGGPGTSSNLINEWNPMVVIDSAMHVLLPNSVS